MFLIDVIVSRTRRNTRRGGWWPVDWSGSGGIPESGGNETGSGRDSLTFQVGNLILPLRHTLVFWLSGEGGGLEPVAMGDGGDIAKKAVSETYWGVGNPGGGAGGSRISSVVS